MTRWRVLVAAVLACSVVLALWLARRTVRSPAPTAYVIVHADPASGIDLAALTWDPPRSARRPRRIDGANLVLELDPGARTLHLRAPSACPVDVPVTESGPPARVALVPWIDFGDERPQVGFDQAVEVRVVAGCPQASSGRIAWRQVEGPPLAGLATEDRGFVVRAHMPPLSATRPGPLPWGIVPLSPRTRGSYALEGTWEGAAGPSVRRTLRFSSAARATGVPAVGLDHRLILGGDGWHVVKRPARASAGVLVSGELASLLPDAAGVWVLEDDAQRRLGIHVGRFDVLPLDCGRAECHAAAAAAAVDSPMTRVLMHGLEGALGPDYDATCALACHAMGEPGTRDGGFVDVARALEFALPHAPAPGLWNATPRELRRLGGVGCAACHGPAMIPERDARWAILRSDVCATCHDMPPRYGHVEAWSRSRMALSDASPDERENALCATCHTTRGFLEALGVPKMDLERARGAPPMGISCAACHAPHGAHEGLTLVRTFEPREGAGADVDPSNRICLACHSPLGASAQLTAAQVPFASAAALWLGTGGGPATPAGGAAAAPHASLRACTGCHTGSGAETGASHSFAANAARCSSCHTAGSGPVERPDSHGHLVQERARALWGRLVARGVVKAALDGGRPPHASAMQATPRQQPLQSVVWATLLVLEDPAAGIHNAPYARAILDDAEKRLDEATSGDRPRPAASVIH